MSDHAWEELLDVIDQKYGIITHRTEKQPLADNRDLEEITAFAIFEKAGQQYKFERVTRPRVVDKKSYYHRSGGASRVENIYDPEETSSKVLLFRKDGENWTQIEPDGIF